jgi:hypothetical protein
MSGDWSTFEVRHRYTRYPRRWTYRKPLRYPRPIFLRDCPGPVVLGLVHRELDGNGRIWYRIDGTEVRFDYLGGAGDALYARHCLSKEKSESCEQPAGPVGEA